MLFTFELESLVAMALKKRNVGHTTTAAPTSLAVAVARG
jgi:hypothetical protein